MTQFTTTSTLETDKKKIPCPRKGEFNFYTAKNGVLKVKNSKCQVQDVVLDRELEGFDITNTFGIDNHTTVIEAIEIFTDNIPTDINQLTDVDNLLNNCEAVTYTGLVYLRDNNLLERGKRYAIWDYVPCWNIFDGGTMNIEEYQVGIGEVLIVTAASVNSIFKEAISASYPSDTIYYSLDLLDNRDIGFGDGAGTPIAIFKGMVYYRKDTVQNVETHYDFRNITFRRWAVDAELFEDGTYSYYTGHVQGMTTDITLTTNVIGVGGDAISLLGDGIKTVAVLVSDWNTANPANEVTVTAGDDTQIPDDMFYMTLDDGIDPIAYVAKDVCKSGIDGKIYKCITATTGEGDPTVNTADWVLWLDIAADAFVSWTSDKASFNIGDITTTNLIINNVTAGVDYDDFYTFGDYYNWVKNVSIGMIDLEYAIGDWSYTTQLNNIVFKTQDDYYTCFGNKLGSNCWNNTIGNGFYNNTIGNGFYKNTIGNGFYKNTIGNGFYKNTIGNNFYYNNIGNDFIYNNIGNDFIYNNIGNNFIYNNIGNNFYYNNIGNDFIYNNIGNNFIYNNIGNNTRKVIFGNTCQKLTIANYLNGTTTNKVITFGDNLTMCNFQDNCFGELAADLDLTAATHIRGAYNTTIYQDKTDGVKLSYMDGGVMQIVAVTA